MYALGIAVFILLIIIVMMWMYKSKEEKKEAKEIDCSKLKFGCCPNKKVPRNDVQGSNC